MKRLHRHPLPPHPPAADPHLHCWRGDQRHDVYCDAVDDARVSPTSFIIENGRVPAVHIIIHDEPRETRSLILERVVNTPDAVLSLEGSKPRDQVQKIKNPTGLLADDHAHPRCRQCPRRSSKGMPSRRMARRRIRCRSSGANPNGRPSVTTIGDNITHGSF